MSRNARVVFIPLLVSISLGSLESLAYDRLQLNARPVSSQLTGTKPAGTKVNPDASLTRADTGGVTVESTSPGLHAGSLQQLAACVTDSASEHCRSTGIGNAVGLGDYLDYDGMFYVVGSGIRLPDEQLESETGIEDNW